MSEKKQDGYGVDDLFSTKARKASTANETHKLSVSIRANRSTVCSYHNILYVLPNPVVKFILHFREDSVLEWIMLSAK